MTEDERPHKAQYRKKPVVIEAMQWTDGIDPREIVRWINAEGGAAVLNFVDVVIEIQTLEGTMLAQPDDWIIRGVKGEFYPCKPDIFEATYDRAPDTGEGEQQHLHPWRSSRGFARLPVVTGTYPGIIQTYESSGASRPQVWVKVTQPTDLNKPEGPWHDATVHLTVEAATQFAEQLLFLVEHHYQTCDRAKREQALANASPPKEGS